MTKQKYNGWTNYETWCVNLWIDNEQGTQEYWAEQAAESYRHTQASLGCTREENATHALASQLKEEHEEALPELTGFAADLLNAAISEVNWHEIAKNMVEACQESEAA